MGKLLYGVCPICEESYWDGHRPDINDVFTDGKPRIVSYRVTNCPYCDNNGIVVIQVESENVFRAEALGGLQVSVDMENKYRDEDGDFIYGCSLDATRDFFGDMNEGGYIKKKIGAIFPVKNPCGGSIIFNILETLGY